MKKTGIIDRFEGELAVIEFEDGMKDIPKSKLPNGVKPGDMLRFEGDSITIDHEGKKKLAKEIEDLANELFED
ncbi:DUF3006 domain-containing protein [Viridibacillus sp. FSL H8-0123]|uniref:DUF3006 domain-containing protein n=1 Tax=Viridibacillus sp. FSL H8-0123 TaxID=1928922 RepID=UPI00096F7D95|nr:DUF3006 domain-containing protein [Viridibacillus sp. FSL H8-0123]OMC83374.1 pyruvate kinase [Viridibacillus sp. FSL H8-0123]